MSGIANAQMSPGKPSQSCLDNIKTQQERLALEQLKKLKIYGNSTVGGQYPKCVDVIAVRNAMKTTIWNEYANQCNPAVKYFSSTHLLEYNNQMLQDSSAEHSELLEGTDLGSKYYVYRGGYGSSSISGGDGCFKGDVQITVGHIEDEKYELQTFDDYVENYDENDAGYVLSSPIEKIPDAPQTYLGPCWSSVQKYSDVELYNGAPLATVTYKPDNKTTSSCVATSKHPFYVEVTDPASGKKTFAWKMACQIDPETMKLVSDLNSRVKVLNVTPSAVEDGWGWSSTWDWDYCVDMHVFTLTTDTGTYYIGDPEHRVLVHNLS
jgi:hypothetical protein